MGELFLDPQLLFLKSVNFCLVRLRPFLFFSDAGFQTGMFGLKGGCVRRFHQMLLCCCGDTHRLGLNG